MYRVTIIEVSPITRVRNGDIALIGWHAVEKNYFEGDVVELYPDRVCVRRVDSSVEPHNATTLPLGHNDRVEVERI